MTNSPEYRDAISFWSTSGEELNAPALVSSVPEGAIPGRQVIEL